jgi:hypothetical protein
MMLVMTMTVLVLMMMPVVDDVDGGDAC